MSVTINISATGNTQCGNILITDISAYTASPNSRADFGIAIMIDSAGVLDTTLSDFTNTTSWIIPVTNGILYTIYAYQVPVWVLANAPYSSLDIVYYNGYFWSNSSGGNTSGIPGTSADWTIVTNDAAGKLLFIAYCSATEQTTTTVTPNCIISKTECYKYTVCNTTAAISYFSVTELDATLVTITTDSNATAVLDSNGNIIAYSLPAYTCTEITLPEEGVYVLGTGTSSTCMPYQYVIFELCKYYDCYFGLIKKILCDDFDPCCTTCDSATIRNNEIFRLTLNKMTGLINALQIKTFYDNVHYGNIMSIPANRLTELAEIADILNMLNDIIVRCGLCNGAQSNEVITPCTNC
jgi:hypothetical protein